MDTWKPVISKETDDLSKTICTEEVKEYMMRTRTYHSNSSKIFMVPLGQCKSILLAGGSYIHKLRYNGRFPEIYMDLENEYLKWNEKFTVELTAAYNMLLN